MPRLLRDLARVGLTTREACGDTVRNITGCHLAGACPFEVLDISPWAEATFRHFLHHPYAQRLPRKFKINFSGCMTDCGQAMFNDIGVVAVARPLPDGTTEAGFRVFIAGGLGANPHPAKALEEFTPREHSAGHAGGGAADLRPLRQPRQQAARPAEMAGRHHGHRRAARARAEGAQAPVGVEAPGPGASPPSSRNWAMVPPGWPSTPLPPLVGTPVTLRLGPGDPYKRWEAANVVIGVAKGTVSAVAYARLGDVTSAQFRELAAVAA